MPLELFFTVYSTLNLRVAAHDGANVTLFKIRMRAKKMVN